MGTRKNGAVLYASGGYAAAVFWRKTLRFRRFSDDFKELGSPKKTARETPSPPFFLHVLRTLKTHWKTGRIYRASVPLAYISTSICLVPGAA
jgi:hypothetical protein